MDVIIGAQSLLGERGGINTYTYNLLKGFAASNASINIKLLVNNRVINQTALPGEAGQVGHSQTNKSRRHLFPGLRSTVGYAIRTMALSRYPEHLFHETNNLLLQTKAPSVVTIHDLSCLKYPEFHPDSRAKLFQKHLPRTVNSADHIITVSQTVRHEILDYFRVDPAKVSAIPLGIDHIETVAPTQSETSRPYFLVVGALEPRKNIATILHALEHIGLADAVKRGIRIVHAGPSGWKNTSFNESIERAIDEDIWEELGTVSHHRLQSLYANATALLYPSVYEGFGIPPFEALLHGCPVVLNDIPVFREFHSHGVRWIEDSDAAQLAEHIIDLHDHPDSARRLGMEGRHEHAAGSGLTWQATAQQTAAIYESVRERTNT